MTTTDRNGANHKGPGRPDGGQFSHRARAEADAELTGLPGLPDVDPDLARSRRALIDVLTALDDQREAFTVLGAHAVAERTQGIPGLPRDDSTRDADIGVTPTLLNDHPRVDEAMAAAGFEPASDSRPGVWGLVTESGLSLHQRLTVDLIAPASVAGNGRRSADLGAHGRRTASKTEGTELMLIDRNVMLLRSFDGGPSVEAYVAGTAALICAKAYKLRDRLDPTELERNPDRLRAKDFTDLYRLTLAIGPDEAREVFDRADGRPDIAAAAALGREHIRFVIEREGGAPFASYVAQAWADYDVDENAIRGRALDWSKAFGRA